VQAVSGTAAVGSAGSATAPRTGRTARKRVWRDGILGEGLGREGGVRKVERGWVLSGKKKKTGPI
jgi:hypothetical protein